MKSIKRSSRKKKITSFILGVLLVVILFIVYSYYAQNSPPKQISKGGGSLDSSSLATKPPTNEQVSTGQAIKQNSLENNNDSDEEESTEDVVIEILPPKPDGHKLQIQTILRTVTNSGKCTLTLSKAGQKTQIQVVGVQALTSYSTCEGFSVDNLSEGTWSIQIDFKNDSRSGSAKTNVQIGQ